MPWTESDAMDQRLQFVTDALSDRFTMTELCERSYLNVWWMRLGIGHERI
jgi:hypothetical protein